ncbi:MAG: hypothetical protein HQM03_11140 [Magnetococcales bacterium]|nr:hypothetical protein [Magnetococcales bacterium]
MATNDTSVTQSGKSGGDAAGGAGGSAWSGGGYGSGTGQAWVQNVDPIGTGVGVGGDAGAGSFAAQVGGDVTDNTNIGAINIS